MKVVVALGGNALIKPDQAGTVQEQMHTAQHTMLEIVHMIQHGWDVVLTHGNGPQVGSILLQQDMTKDVITPMPLDVCVAQTQGQIGYILQQSLNNALQKAGIDRRVATIITQVLVSDDDPAFVHPTKPVGPVYQHDEALHRLQEGYILTKQKGGWRIVVPSPDPLRIVEDRVIKKLIEDGDIVIAVGGGGIPVMDATGERQSLSGREAVIDKDLASEKLASAIEANVLLLLTDVDAVYTNYGSENEEKLGEVTLQRMEKYYQEGHFPPGSMGPKVLAAIRFLQNGGSRAIISSITHAWDALKGVRGTQITK
jgi:carbamate kinase